jgi:cytochrome P450
MSNKLRARKWTEYHPQHIAHMDFFRVGYTARDIVFDAFRTYCRSLPADASEVVRERERVLRDAGVSEDDIAKQEASFCSAVFPNTVPTMYWSIVELFSRPGVLDAVRRELEANAVRRNDDEDRDTHTVVLDVAALKTRCPLLLSVLQETQRTRAVNAMVRKVMDDTVLDGRYLLKKGNFLQIPSQPLHLSTAHWGASAETFDPYRFVAAGASAGDVEKERAGSSSSSSASSMFMPWGAAPHLCPARQFATTEIMTILALLALRVELKPAGRDGRWDREAPLVTGDLVTVLNPAREARLVVSVRDGGDGTWKLEMGDSRTKVPLASG